MPDPMGSHSIPQVLTLATVLLGMTAVAQPVPLQLAAPRAVLLTARTGEAHEIRVAPGFLTTLRLDALVAREAVEVEGRARFSVDAGDQTLSIEPLAPLEPHESRILRVHYRAGTPAFAVFRLLAATDEVDTVVTVRRPQPPAEPCLKAQLPTAIPASLGLAGLVDKEGVKVEISRYPITSPGPLTVGALWRLRGSTWAVVVLEAVTNTGQEPWTPAWAEVTSSSGGPSRKARALLPLQVTLEPHEPVRMAVEVEMPQRGRPKWLQEPHTLALCDAAGRCLTLPNVKL